MTKDFWHDEPTTFRGQADMVIAALTLAETAWNDTRHADAEVYLVKAHHHLAEVMRMNDKVRAAIVAAGIRARLADKVTPLRRVAMEAGKKEVSQDGL